MRDIGEDWSDSVDSHWLQRVASWKIKKFFIILSMFLFLFATSQAAVDKELRLWNTETGTGVWTTGNIVKYNEGDCIPTYLMVRNTGTATDTFTLDLTYDAFDPGILPAQV